MMRDGGAKNEKRGWRGKEKEGIGGEGARRKEWIQKGRESKTREARRSSASQGGIFDISDFSDSANGLKIP